jgi:hypothetical protein
MKYLLTLLVVLCLAASANAALLTDNFDDNDISDWTVVSGTGWAAGVGEMVKLVDDTVFSNITKSFTGVSSGMVYLEWLFTISGDWRPGTAGLVDSTGKGVILNAYVGDDYIEIGAGPTTDWAASGTMSSADITADPTSGVTMKYELNLDTGDVKGYINGVLKNTVNVDLTGVGDITNCVFYTKKQWHVDDVVVDIPEPASLALLGFGGLGMLIRRKR